MILTDRRIRQAIDEGRIEVQPTLDEQHLRPAGIRIHLDFELLIPCPGQLVDLQTPSDLAYDRVDLRNDPFVLAPGAFVLAGTIEKVKTCPNLLITLEGRSTIARLGLTIHNTASILDVHPEEWFCPVLEIANHGSFSVRLRPGIPIGMLCFQELGEPSSLSRFHDQYKDQTRLCAPNLLRGASLYPA